jgi:lipopolysaccharide/colanic/teichoic acid biosynthesis glycosyltransferase
MATVTTTLGKSLLPGAVSAACNTSLYARWGKRLFDIVASLAGLAILSPILMLCALLVRLTSRGQALFRQTRVGYQGQLFRVIKFRTMRQGAEGLGSAVVVEHDRRLTPVGNFLRRTKLDELPQMINVLLGEMSIVGPRPRVPSEANLDDPRERVLLSARPGITSYASIHHRMEADYCARRPDPQEVHRAKLLPQKRLLDCEYVRNQTFRLDLKLIVLTILLIFLPGRSLAKRLCLLGRKAWPYRHGAQMMLDLALYMAAAGFAYTCWFEAGLPDFYRRQMWRFVLLVPGVRVIVHRALGVFDMMWRYINLEDGLLLALAFAPVSLVLLILRLWLPTSSRVAVPFLVPLGVITLEYLITLTAGLGLRCLRRMLYQLQQHYQPLPEAAHRVLILGAGLLGLTTAVDMRRYPHMQLVGFLDDDPSKYRRLIAGCRVLGNSDDLEALCLRHKVTDVVICAKSMDPTRLLELFQRCSTLKVKPHVLPSLDRLLRDESIVPAATLTTNLAYDPAVLR